MATIQIRVDDTLKASADALFASMGFDTSTAVRMFLSAAIDNRGLPFDVKKRQGRIELNDGYGSYICEHGYVHDYKKLAPVLAEAEKDIIGPFNSVDEMLKSLNDED